LTLVLGSNDNDGIYEEVEASLQTFAQISAKAQNAEAIDCLVDSLFKFTKLDLTVPLKVPLETKISQDVAFSIALSSIFHVLKLHGKCTQNGWKTVPLTNYSGAIAYFHIP
jgi:hypothetical protein